MTTVSEMPENWDTMSEAERLEHSGWTAAPRMMPTTLPPNFYDTTTERMTQVRLYGRLGRKFGRNFRLSVRSVREAVHAIDALRPGFRAEIARMKSYDFAVQVGDRFVGERHLGLNNAGRKISIRPIAQGSGTTMDIFEIVGGIALIALGYFVPVLAPFTTGLGLSLILGGVAGLIAGTPHTDDTSTKQKPSYQFGGAQNLVQQGAPAALPYGKIYAGSVVGSLGVENKDVTGSDDHSGDPPGYGGGDVSEGTTYPQDQLYYDEPTIFSRKEARGALSGSGSSGSGATEDPDTLQSKAYARIKDIIGEGPIRGLVGDVEFGQPDRSIYLDDMPLQNDDGTYNFKDYQHTFQLGTQDQDFVTGFDAEEATTDLGGGVQLRNGGNPTTNAWLHNFTNPNLDAIRVDVLFPQLQETNKKNGDIHGSKVHLEFDYNIDGAGWVTAINHTLRGKASSAYVHSYLIEVPQADKPFTSIQVRVKRLTIDDLTNEFLQNKTYIKAYTEITYSKLRHPNTSISNIYFDAERFPNIPVRTYHIYGLIVDIPSNYNPDTGVNTGDWDGTFVRGWTCNPAWVLWDIITHNRYGLGNYIPESALDKWAFYACAQHCDELVPDGFGGMEHRYECHAYIAGKKDAIQVLNDIAGIFQATAAYISGVIMPVEDRYVAPEQYGAQFNPSNVEGGELAFSTPDARASVNTVLVSYSNPLDMGRPIPEYVDDQDEINKAGAVKDANVTAFGCYSRGQAHRRGRWIILSNKLRKDLSTFNTGLEGAATLPGDIVTLHAPFRAGKTFGGRLHAATLNSATLDRQVTLEAGRTYKLTIYAADGSRQTPQISNAPSTTSVLNFTAALASLPVVQTAWTLQSDTLVPQPFRVLDAKTLDNLRTQLSCISYEPSLYDAVDLGTKLEPLPIQDLPSAGVCLPPTNAVTTQRAITDPTGVHRVIEVTWDESPDPFLRDYVVSYRYNRGNWKELPSTRVAVVDVPIISTGTYDFQIIARNVRGAPSVPLLATELVLDTNPLVGATISHLEIVNKGADLTFNTPDVPFGWVINSPSMVADSGDLDDPRLDPFFQSYIVTIYRDAGRTQVLQAPIQVAQSTYTFTLEANQIASATNWNLPPHSTFTIGVKLLDAFGNVSAESAITVSKVKPGQPTNLLMTPADAAMDLQWDNATDPSIDHVEIRLNGFASTIIRNIPARGIAKASYHFDGLSNGSSYKFVLRTVDKFGLTSSDNTGANTSWVESPWSPKVGGQSIIPAIAAVVFSPAGGQVPSGTALKLSCPTQHPDLKIYYTTDGTIPSDNTSDGHTSLYGVFSGGIGLFSSGTVTAVAYINGLHGPATAQTFTIGTAQQQGVSMTPADGNYTTPNGQLDVSLDSTGADAIFYTYSTDPAVVPPDPTHAGAAGTGTTQTIAGASGVITLNNGFWRFKIMAYKSGKTDSAITLHEFSVAFATGSTSTAGGAGTHLPQ